MNIVSGLIIYSFIWVIICEIKPTDSYIDLFLDANETKTLLGKKFTSV